MCFKAKTRWTINQDLNIVQRPPLLPTKKRFGRFGIIVRISELLWARKFSILHYKLNYKNVFLTNNFSLHNKKG